MAAEVARQPKIWLIEEIINPDAKMVEKTIVKKEIIDYKQAEIIVHKRLPSRFVELDNIMAFKMFVVCMKTINDFIKLSAILDALPLLDYDDDDDDDFINEVLAFMAHGGRLRDFPKRQKYLIDTGCELGCKMWTTQTRTLYSARVTSHGDFLAYRFGLKRICLSLDFIKDLTIDVYVTDVLSIELVNSGKTIMPAPDGYHMKVFRDFVRFTIKCDMWFPLISGISEIELNDRLVIKTVKPLKLPVKIIYRYLMSCTPVRIADYVVEKNKVIKTGSYWQNTRMNGDVVYKTEVIKYM